MIQITPRVYQLGSTWGSGLRGTNVFLLADDHPTLVDTGFRGRTGKILKELRRIGYYPTDIKHIVITHHHRDHIGSLSGLKKTTWARVIAHPADAPYINGTLPQPGPARPPWLSKILSNFHWLWSTTPVAVDMTVNDGDVLPILGGTRVIHTPGHTPGSISLFIPQERLIIIGDVIARRAKLSLPSRTFTVDLSQEIQSIKKITDLDFDIACFGHGAPLTRDAHPAITDFYKMVKRQYRGQT